MLTKEDFQLMIEQAADELDSDRPQSLERWLLELSRTARQIGEDYAGGIGLELDDSDEVE